MNNLVAKKKVNDNVFNANETSGSLKRLLSSSFRNVSNHDNAETHSSPVSHVSFPNMESSQPMALLNHRNFVQADCATASSYEYYSSKHPPIKYHHFNESHSSTTNTNIVRHMHGSTVSNTMTTIGSVMSDNTQQTTLSSSKLNSCGLPTLNENSVTSGSGSGVPHLVEKTFAKEIELLKCIGRGRFSEVWLGTRLCEKVVVKITFSSDDQFWRKEQEIFNKIILKHANIVRYLGSDIISKNSSTQLWLVTDYYPMGNLFDYLNRETIKTPFQLLSFMKSIIFGLSYLHTQIVGTIVNAVGKPSIAHRDIKSKNILIKSNFDCCLADFSLAVVEKNCSTLNSQYVSCAIQHSSVRYLAPEVLDGSILDGRFETFRKADM